MFSVAILTQVLGLAIGAGLNLYAAVIVTGMGIRFGWLPSLSGDLQVLAHPAVLITAGILYGAEFIADKVPFFTPIWDAIHTFIRPVGGAFLALGATGNMDPMVRMLAMLAAGTVALGAHSSKMGVRLLAHTTPEPITHSIISVAEDVGVVGLLILVYQYPKIALPLIFVLMATMVVLLPSLVRSARFLLAGLWGKVASLFDLAPFEGVAGWVPVGAVVVRVFSRKFRGAPRLTPGYLLLYENRTQFAFRRWGRTKIIDVGFLKAELLKGFVFDVATCAGGSSFYVAKEWSPRITSRTLGAASLQKMECK